MATITSPSIIRTMLENGGTFPLDPSIKYPLIYSYIGRNGREVYAIFADACYDDLATSPFASTSTCFMANSILTEDGKRWLQRGLPEGYKKAVDLRSCKNCKSRVHGNRCLHSAAEIRLYDTCNHWEQTQWLP